MRRPDNFCIELKQSGNEERPVTLAPELLAKLAAIDTPTVCNALEVVAPARRSFGFNRQPLVCPFPTMKPIVGYARTATIRAREPNPKTAGDPTRLRMAYYEYIERGPKPSIAVLQDLDGPDRGIGAFWGEVQTNVHLALGCAGVVTDGSVRDIDQMAAGFFVLAGSIMPSHVHADLVDIDVTVSILGMVVAPGDLIHADRHGAVVMPADVAAKVPDAAAMLARREKVILDACKRPGFSIADIRTAFAQMKEIH
jgi:regulator of RNase E activity RraA